MKLLIEFFGCGKVKIRSKTECCDYYVLDFSNIYETIIPHFFFNYPLYGIKSLDFSDFHAKGERAAHLFKVGGRSNSEAIKEIIKNMNSKREGRPY